MHVRFRAAIPRLFSSTSILQSWQGQIGQILESFISNEIMILTDFPEFWGLDRFFGFTVLEFGREP
jgi:hypothetical protein